MRWPSLAIATFLLAACGASRNDAEDNLVDPNSDAGDDVVLADATDDALLDDAGSKRPPFDAGSPWEPPEPLPDDMFPPDPDCGDASIPLVEPTLECDPVADGESSGCEAGEVCALYEIPANSACEPTTYRATCIRVGGSNTHGEPCDPGCKQGFVCSIAGAGRQCMKLCRVNEVGGCEEGLVCMNLRNLPDFGVCS